MISFVGLIVRIAKRFLHQLVVDDDIGTHTHSLMYNDVYMVAYEN